MIKETRTWYCDACGKQIEGYSGSIDVIEFDDDGFPQSSCQKTKGRGGRVMAEFPLEDDESE